MISDLKIKKTIYYKIIGHNQKNDDTTRIAQCMRIGKDLIAEYQKQLDKTKPSDPDSKLREYTEGVIKACMVKTESETK
jgi:hypothetical protein